mgnify:CR=1 FL=1
MHQIIPINCINKCIICFDHTLQKNSCVQCNGCFLCKKCLKVDLEKCPICRKENFKKEPLEKKCFLKKILLFVILLLICFLLGTFFRMLSGDFSLGLLDIWINVVLGVFILSLFLMLDLFCRCNFCRDIEY